MNDIKIAIIGLGYVGLPLARLFATKYAVVGFDIKAARIKELQNGIDTTLELEPNTLQDVLKNTPNNDLGLYCTTSSEDIRDCNYYIVTVPSPIDKKNRPDLTPLYNSSETVGSVLKKGDIVIYESTVYPGVTEDECVPILEKISGLKFNEDFFVGYSPERINPGDKLHTVDKILKITSGSTPKVGEKVTRLYASVITAGTYLAPSIKVAEAAKVIENSQRDINIAFVNELAKIFNLMHIDTHSVLKAAQTKWNFLPFKPGLVGGHCIGVDPYYLAQKAQEAGYYPEIILAGRRINDSMGSFVSAEIVKKMAKKDISIKGSNALLLGFTFKENCPDIRNTRVIDIYQDLKEFGLNVIAFDPWVNQTEVIQEYGIEVKTSFNEIQQLKFEVIILAVAHDQFLKLDLKELRASNYVVYDIKGMLPLTNVDGRL